MGKSNVMQKNTALKLYKIFSREVKPHLTNVGYKWTLNSIKVELCSILGHKNAVKSPKILFIVYSIKNICFPVNFCTVQKNVKNLCY